MANLKFKHWNSSTRPALNQQQRFSIAMLFTSPPEYNGWSTSCWKFCGDNSSFSIFSNFFKKIYIKAIFNFSIRMLYNIFLKKILNFFCTQNLKKAPSKVAQNSSNPVFFPYCPDFPKGSNRRIPVPKCGLLTNCI